MLTLSRVTKIVGVMMCLGMVTPVLAESAPVYDADTMQQDDGMVDQAQDMAPPAPEGGPAYVPSQQPTLSVEQAPPMSAPAVVSGSVGGTVEQRLRRMEQQLNNVQTGEGVSKVESLQEQVQTLRGQVEQLTHQLEQLQNQQKSMYSDLDTRLSQQAANASKQVPVSSAPPESYSSPAGGKLISKANGSKQTTKPDAVVEKATTTQPNVAEEQQIYQTAYNLIKAKKYNDAVMALQGMLKKYPSGQFASNAHYWLGELYGLMGKNDQALTEFSTVVKVYPDSPRISDAQLKVGLLLASQMKWVEAKTALKKVVNRYPGTASARLASEQLKQIKDAGH